jgi:alpha-D-xyloside xylohydrolase
VTFCIWLSGTGTRPQIWNFGNASEAAIVKVMRMREQMRPYIMTLYEQASSEGAPVMRPLFFDFWDDEGAQLVSRLQV